MATESNDEKAPGSRLLLLIAILALVVVSAAAFSRVFQGGAALRLSLAATIAVLLAGALERRHVLLATLVSAGGLAVTIGLLIFPDTTRFGLPTATTLRVAARAWAAIGRTADAEVAPAVPLRPLLLAGLTAVWAASFSAHSLAVRARSPFLALLPPAALVAFTSIILGEGGHPLSVLLFLASAMAVLFADGLRRVGQWGPVTMWQQRRRLRFGTATTTRGARRVALVCLGVAVFLPGLLPGYRSPGLVDVHGGANSLHVSIDPIVDIRPRLLLSTPVPLFTVRSSQGAYWRFLALDNFNGQLWTASNIDASGGREVGRGDLRSAHQASTGVSVTQTLTQHFEFQRLSQPWLPMAYDPVSIQLSGEKARYDAGTSLLVAPDGTSAGFSYDVTSREVVPTPESLDAVASLAGSDTSRYTQLPKKMPPEIAAIAHHIADDQPGPYRKILAIQDYLRKFRYDEHVPAGHDVNHILYFLTRSRAGYCEQFAGTMAVLLRSLGIPARVAVGFTPGSPDPATDTWEVTTDNAHAWVEVLFPTYGWLPFEPTPTIRNPVAAPYIFPPAKGEVPGGDIAGCRTLKGEPGHLAVEPCDPRAKRPKRGGGTTPLPSPSVPINPEPPKGKAGSTAARRTNWRAIGIRAAAGLLALFLLTVPASKSVRRRIAVARARGPRQRVLTAYRVMTDQARDVGLGRRPFETLWEYRSRLKASVGALDGDFDRLTGLAGRAAYSERWITPQQAEGAVAAAWRAAREIRRSTGVGRRLAGWFRFDRSTLVRWATG